MLEDDKKELNIKALNPIKICLVDEVLREVVDKVPMARL